MGALTRGIRLHHGYFGLPLLAIALALTRRNPRWARALFVFGAALLLSDAVHHFLVLWPLTGDPDFDFVYPAR